MTEFEFDLADRIQKIKSIDEQYNLRDNAYISFSGGKDSSVLSVLIDIALPGNEIPRLFLNTGIEYVALTQYVREKAAVDPRIVILNPKKNIRSMLEEVGYPFKSKEFAQKLSLFQRKGKTKTVTDYLGETGNKAVTFQCPSKLKECFSDSFNLKVSDKCCYEMKKNPAQEWGGQNNKPITITGVRKGEGGLRKSMQGCTVFDTKGLHKFHPLFPCSNSFIEEFIKTYDIELCKLYYPPYNFERTGCKGCPFNPKLKKQLEMMEELLPSEKKQCELLWKPVYDLYRKLKYRLDTN